MSPLEKLRVSDIWPKVGYTKVVSKTQVSLCIYILRK